MKFSAVDIKTLVTVASLLAAGVSGVMTVKTDVATAQTDILALKSDIAEIRQTQLTSAGRIEFLFNRLLTKDVASAK